MHVAESRTHRGVRFVLLAAAVALGGCGKEDRRHEVDYNYEVLKKSADGSVTVVDTGKVERATTGDGGGVEIPGVGRTATRVRGLSATAASIEVTLPWDKTATLELSPKKTEEQFPAGSEYGVRMTLMEIRGR